MSKRKKLKNFWCEKVVPNKGKIARRVIRAGAIYSLTGPAAALASNLPFNETALAEGYAAILDSCLGGRRLGFIPVPRSYVEGSLCVALLLTCGVATAQGLGNPTVDAACIALVRTLSAQQSA